MYKSDVELKCTCQGLNKKVKVSKKFETNSQGFATLQRRPSLVNGFIMFIALWISIVMGQRIPFIVIVAGGFMPQGQRRKV